MLTGEDRDSPRVIGLIVLNFSGLVIAQFNNYYNWPDASPPAIKKEVHVAGKETRIRCHIRDHLRHIQNGLNLTWEYKPCLTESCLDTGTWSALCGGHGSTRCPPILTLVKPRAYNSGLYRCHVTLDGSPIILNIYMLQFTENRREPPVIVGGMNSNVTVVAPSLAVLQCKVHSPVPPVLRWFRRLQSPASSHNLQSKHNFIQYLNNTYQLLNCCPVAALSQKDLYLSKLMIYSSSIYDSGFYICLAINDANYTFKESYINVVPLLKTSGEKTQGGSLVGLFLIPALFALIPALVWVACFRHRKLESISSPVPVRSDKQGVIQNHLTPKPMCGPYVPVLITSSMSPT